MSLLLELAVILLLIIANGLFAMSEIAVVTSRKSRLQQRASRGDAGARTALELARDPTEFLSAVQVGITLVGILAGAFGGARLARDLAGAIDGIAFLAPYAYPLAFALIVGSITFVTLIIGELVPKEIGLAAPERVAARIARPMRRLGRVVRPLVALLSATTDAILKLFKLTPKREPAVTEEDIRMLMAQGARAGVVQRVEHDIVERVFLLGDRQTGSIATPRHDIEWVDVDAPVDTLVEAVRASDHSRLLVCEGRLDRVVGVVRARALLAQALTGKPLDLRLLVQQPLFVPETMPVYRLLEMFRQSDVHLAVVLDEYGGVVGVATINDIFDDLVAGIPGAVDEENASIVRREDGSWLVDGALSLEDLELTLALEPMTFGERRGFRTVGGLAMDRLGHIPEVGETFEVAGHRFEIVDLDGRRIDRLMITAPPPSE